MEHDLSFISKSNLTWLRDNTIFLTVHGSHSYGTNIATSDIDYRGIAIAPLDYYLSFSKGFEQQIFKDPDAQIFDLKKFFTLAANCNPNALEIIFTDPKFHLISHPIMKKLFDNRYKFLSQRVQFCWFGYAKSQLNRINSHYNRFKDAPTKPNREDFGLPEQTAIPENELMAIEAAITKKLDQWNPDFSMLDNDLREEVKQKITDLLTEIGAASIYLNKEELWKEAALSSNITPNMIAILKKEKEYTNKLKEWKSYEFWLKTRNETRAALEKEHGYDTKHAMHLVRLCRSCIEMLETGELNVFRKDADELLEVRAGKLSYKELIDYTDELSKKIEEAAKNTKLPYSVDKVFLNNLCCDMIKEFSK